jgi:YidC/Oxa1 family membrane protein insertase
MLAVYGIFYIFVMQPRIREYEKYRKEHPELADQATSPSLAGPAATTGTVRTEERPTTGPATVAEQAETSGPLESKAEEVVVSTPLHHVVLTTRGGRPTSWIYYNRISGHKETEPIEMIPQRPDEPRRELPLEVVFKESNRWEYTEFNTRNYTYEVSRADDGSTRVVFTSPIIRNIQIEKAYTFRPGSGPESHLTGLQVTVRNLNEKAPIRLNDNERGVGISWGPGFRNYAPGETPDARFIRTVYATPGGVKNAQLRDSSKEPVAYRGPVEWAGATDKFFLAAVIPKGTKLTAVEQLVRRKNDLADEEKKSQTYHSPPFTIVAYNDPVELPPQRQLALTYQLFVGSKEPQLLAQVDKATGARLDRVLFFLSTFGWMRAIKLGLMKSLNWLHWLTGNYGLAIVILTFLIRLVMHPLAHKGMKMQAKTMAEMQKIKPYLDEVNKKYADNAAKRNEETMRTYREHGISPLAPLRGCLPMLVQLPIFFALYSLLNQSIDLRGASFLWIADLSQPDKLVDLTKYGMDFYMPLVGWHVNAVNLLPLLMGASQFIMSKVTPTPSRDPSQKQMMLMFSLFFPIMLYTFPSGLFIYWLINNVWQSIHQLVANRAVGMPAKCETARA